MQDAKVLRDIMGHAQRLVQFFGVGLDQVDPLLLTLVDRHGRRPWLRGKTRLNDLPRFDTACTGSAFPVLWSYEVDITTRIVWIVEHLFGPWRLYDTLGPSEMLSGTLVFAEPSDAVHYRLNYNDPL